MLAVDNRPLSFGIIFLAILSTYSIAAAQAQKEVRQISIHSHWGGLGPRQDAAVTILREQNSYRRDGETVDPALVDALVTSLETPRIASPDLANLGITETWLKSQATQQLPRSSGQATKTTRGQQALFEASFTDPKVIAGVLPDIFKNWHTDDYPSARVEVAFADGSKLSAYTSSQFIFMLPWCIGNEKLASFNADISRAVSALLPEKTVNKDRLTGIGLSEELTEAVMSSIDTEWNLRGAEEMVGGSLTTLRQKYQVTATEIDPYLRPEYGPQKYNPNAEEMSIHATLRKSSFPPNVFDALSLRIVNGKVEGIPDFLNTGAKYENLVFSIPWLNSFIREHPQVPFHISYVGNASFGEKAMRTFNGDMELRERKDLIEKIKPQQSQIALLMVGWTYSESYWLVFPDKHMLLWRYIGPGGLLKWTPAEFGEGECADYRMSNGGCSGREVSPDGNLVPEGTPRDAACVAAWQAKHPRVTKSSEALFDVMDHGHGGFINRNGTVVIPLCFDTVSKFSENLARFERDGKWGYMDPTGTIVIQPKFPWAEEFHDGLAHVQVTGTTLGYDGRWGYIDRAGRVVIAPDHQRMMSDEDGEESAFQDGLAMVEVEGKSVPPKKGFIDKKGRLVIPARFTYAYPFSEGFAAVTESESGDSGWGYIDKAGSWAIPPRFDWASSFQIGLASVNRKKNCGYIDKSGEYKLRLPSPGGQGDCASAWGDFTDGLSRWRFGSKYGFIDRSGKTVIEPQFELTFGFSEGLAAVQVGKKWGYIDTAGKMVIEPQDLSSAKPFHNGLAQVVTQDGRWGYIDKSGKHVWRPRLQGAD